MHADIIVTARYYIVSSGKASVSCFSGEQKTVLPSQ